MPENPIPTYIYKLIPSTSPVPTRLPSILPLSPLDQKSNFIHLSTSLQVPRTLKHFFADEPLVYVLRLNYAQLEPQLRWEDPKGEVCGERAGEGMFAVSSVFTFYFIYNFGDGIFADLEEHLYNGLKVGKDEVESVAVWERGERGWDEVLENEKEKGWLIY
jgi:uncharacterized protein (DUF952 family)